MDTDKQITVQRTVNASADRIFEVLSNPERHADLDGSGFVVSDDRSDRITGTGQVFTMNMTGDHMGGDYQTDNHVVGFDPNHLIAWKTAPAGTEPPGWQWAWTLTSQDDSTTDVALTYDWTQVTDPDLLAKVSFPLVSEAQLEDSLQRLAATVDN